MRKKITALALGTAGLIMTAGTAHAGPAGYALTPGGQEIVVFDPANPAGATTVALSGDAQRLDAFDFRPDTGELIGFDATSDQYFRVDPNTGATTRIDDGALSRVPGGSLDVDFNPTIDRLRLVTGGEDNIVFNPNNGATTIVTDLFYAAGDPNAGANGGQINVIGNAYTNSFAGATTTTQFVIDSATDSLGILANNAGSITTVGGLTLGGEAFDARGNGGFDIFFDEGENIAYALLNSGDLTGLFLIELTTGALTLIGEFSIANLTGLAIGSVNDVPIPAAFPLFLAGLFGLGFARRSRSRRAA